MLEYARHQSREKLVALQDRRVMLEEKLRLVKEEKGRDRSRTPETRARRRILRSFRPKSKAVKLLC